MEKTRLSTMIYIVMSLSCYQCCVIHIFLTPLICCPLAEILDPLNITSAGVQRDAGFASPNCFTSGVSTTCASTHHHTIYNPQCFMHWPYQLPCFAPPPPHYGLGGHI